MVSGMLGKYNRLLEFLVTIAEVIQTFNNVDQAERTELTFISNLLQIYY